MINNDLIPKRVISKIKQRANEVFAGEAKYIDTEIELEKEAYIKFQNIDYSEISLKEKNKILKHIKDMDTWDEKVSYIEDELVSIKEIKELCEIYKNSHEFNNVKNKAERKYRGEFFYQKEYIIEEMKRIDFIKSAESVKTILIDMEKIVGNSCYNDHIQNYSRWGEWESEGRMFRYPVSFYINGENYKRNIVDAKISSEDLMTGYYAFGANNLMIYKALYKILKYLEENHGLILPKK